MTSPLTIQSKRNHLIFFFALSFLIAWGFWIPSALADQGQLAFPVPKELAGLLGAWAPCLSAILITVFTEGGKALRMLLKRLLGWRAGFHWYLFVLFWPAVLSLTVTGISILFGSPPPDFSNPPVLTLYPAPPEVLSYGALALLPMVFLTQVFGSSLGEELGWRGYALPRLQARRNVVVSSLILGLAWSIWHIPRLWVPRQAFDLVGFAWFTAGIVLVTVLYTWVFNHTGGSLLLVVLFHTSQAVTTLFLAHVANPALETLLSLIFVSVVVATSETDLVRKPAGRAEKPVGI